MADFKTRLLTEQSELAERIYKLTTFLDTKEAGELDKAHSALLEIQLQVMRSYLQILDERIRLLGL